MESMRRTDERAELGESGRGERTATFDWVDARRIKVVLELCGQYPHMISTGGCQVFQGALSGGGSIARARSTPLPTTENDAALPSLNNWQPFREDGTPSEPV